MTNFEGPPEAQRKLLDSYFSAGYGGDPIGTYRGRKLYSEGAPGMSYPSTTPKDGFRFIYTEDGGQIEVPANHSVFDVVEQGEGPGVEVGTPPYTGDSPIGEYNFDGYAKGLGILGGGIGMITGMPMASAIGSMAGKIMGYNQANEVLSELLPGYISPLDYGIGDIIGLPGIAGKALKAFDLGLPGSSIQGQAQKAVDTGLSNWVADATAVDAAGNPVNPVMAMLHQTDIEDFDTDKPSWQEAIDQGLIAPPGYQELMDTAGMSKPGQEFAQLADLPPNARYDFSDLDEFGNPQIVYDTFAEGVIGAGRGLYDLVRSFLPGEIEGIEDPDVDPDTGELTGGITGKTQEELVSMLDDKNFPQDQNDPNFVPIGDIKRDLAGIARRKGFGERPTPTTSTKPSPAPSATKDVDTTGPDKTKETPPDVPETISAALGGLSYDDLVAGLEEEAKARTNLRDVPIEISPLGPPREFENKALDKTDKEIGDALKEKARKEGLPSSAVGRRDKTRETIKNIEANAADRNRPSKAEIEKEVQKTIDRTLDEQKRMQQGQLGLPKTTPPAVPVAPPIVVTAPRLPPI